MQIYLRIQFFYLTQGYLSYKDNKRIYYTDIFVIRKLLLYLINQKIWRNMSLMRTRLRYLEQNMMWVLGAFLVLSTVRLIWLFLVITTRVFFDYGYSKENSKILYSTHKMKVPNSFSTTIFNRHRIQYESGAFSETESSNIFFYLPSTVDRIEEINK